MGKSQKLVNSSTTVSYSEFTRNIRNRQPITSRMSSVTSTGSFPPQENGWVFTFFNLRFSAISGLQLTTEKLQKKKQNKKTTSTLNCCYLCTQWKIRKESNWYDEDKSEVPGTCGCRAIPLTAAWTLATVKGVWAPSSLIKLHGCWLPLKVGRGLGQVFYMILCCTLSRTGRNLRNLKETWSLLTLFCEGHYTGKIVALCRALHWEKICVYQLQMKFSNLQNCDVLEST